MKFKVIQRLIRRFKVIQTILPNGSPSLLVALAVSEIQINLSWTNGSTNEDGINIERSTDGINFSEIDTVGSGTSNYSDLTCTENTKYYYRIRAFLGSHYSAYSNVDSDTTFCIEFTTIYNGWINKSNKSDSQVYNAFVKREVDAGRWAKYDSLVIRDIVTNDDDEAMIDWIDPTRFETQIHWPIFVPYDGFTPDGVNDYINSEVNLSLGGWKCSQNDFSFGYYGKTANDKLNCGGYVNAGVCIIGAAGNSAGKAIGYINSAGSIFPVGSGKPSGYVICTRDGANTIQIYTNKDRYTDIDASAAFPNLKLYTLGAINNNGALAHINTHNIKMRFFGKYLTQAEVEALEDSYDIVRIYNEAQSIPDYDRVDNTTKVQLAIPTSIPADDATIHPGFVDCGSIWNGYRYWMVTTPYTNSNSDYENPEIVCSNDGTAWIVPPGGSNPIYPTPATHYADVCLYFESNTLYCGFMEASAPEVIWLAKSIDGITWIDKTIIASTADGNGDTVEGSPSIVKVGSIYYLYHITDMNPGIWSRRSSSNIFGPYTAKESVTMPYVGSYYWWHFTVRYSAGIYYLLANISTFAGSSGADVYLGKSSDGLTFTRKNHPILHATGIFDHQFYTCCLGTIGIDLYIFYTIWNPPGDYSIGRVKVYIY